LFDAAKKMLEDLQEPYEEYEADFAVLGKDFFDVAELGKIVEAIGKDDNKFRSYITGINYNYGDITRSKIMLANKPRSMAGTVSELMDRQRVEQTYSQGATQIYAQSVQANADTRNGAVLNFYIPEDMIYVNKITAKIELSQFRAYSRTTRDGGNVTTSQSNITSSGSSTSSTTESGGSRTTRSNDEVVSDESSRTSTDGDGAFFQTTESGGGQTSGEAFWNISGRFSSGGMSVTNFEGDGDNYHAHTMESTHNHDVEAHGHYFELPEHSHSMRHNHRISGHSHEIDEHVHDMRHTHNIAHTHGISGHLHDITPGIYFFGDPGSFNIRVNGKAAKFVEGCSGEMDITDMLLDGMRNVQRGTFHRIEVVPDDLAYVTVDVNVQGFIQSRGERQI